MASGDNAPSTLHHMYSYLAMLFLMQVRRSLHCHHHGMQHAHLCVVSVMCMWMQLVGNMRSVALQRNSVTQRCVRGLTIPTAAPTTPTAAPTTAAPTVCADTPNWANPYGNGCDAYLSKGWCADGDATADNP